MMQPTKTEFPDNPPAARRLPLLRVWLPSALIFCAAVALALASMQAFEQDQRNSFQEESHEIEHLILQRLQDYELIMRGGLGLLRNTPKISRSQWRAYVESLDFGRFNPGTLGLGYSVRVPGSQLAAHERERQADDSPGYRVHPGGARAEYCPVVFLEPLGITNQHIIGFDRYSEPARRAALDQARDTGLPTITGRVQLLQKQDKGGQPSFLLQLPVYAEGAPTGTVAERRAALRGFVYMPLRMNALMRSILGSRSMILGLEIYDGETVDPKTLMYSLPRPGPAGAPGFQRQAVVDVYGRKWTLDFTAPRKAWLDAGRREPLGILLLGAVLAGTVLVLTRDIDATRRRAEALALKMTKELRQSESYNRVVFQNSSVGIGLGSPEGLVLDANPVLLEILGYAREEFIGRSWLSITHPEDMDQNASLIQETLDGTRDAYQLEKRYLKKDGSPVWVHIDVACVRGDDGRVRFFIGVTKDISELKTAEAARAEHEALYQAMFEDNKSVALLVDQETTDIVDANRAAEMFYGYTRAELRGMPLGRINTLPPSALAKRLAEASEQGKMFRFTHRLKDGTMREVEVHTGPFRTGERRLLLSTIQDITDRVQAEAALSESRERFQALVEAMDEGVVLTDAEERVTYANPAFAKMLGCEAAALTGRNFAEFFQSEQALGHPARMAARRDGSRRPYKAELCLTDGRSLLTRIMPFPLYGQDSEYRGSCGIIRDITAETAAQEADRQRQVRRNALLRLHEMHQCSRQELLDFALAQVLVMTDSPVGYIYAYDDTSRQFVLHSWSEGIMEQCGVQEPQTLYHLDQTGVWGDVVRLRRPVLMNDFAAPDPRKKGLPEGHVPLSRFLSIPVISAGRVVAVVGVGNKAAPYVEEDVAQLNLFTDSLWGILERQRAEQELREVTERFHLAVRAGRIGLWDWDLGSGAMHCDSVMEGLFGITDQNRTGTPEDWLCRVHPEDRKAVRQALATAREKGRRFEASFRVERPGRGLVHLEASAVVHLDPQGQPLRMIGVNIDVTRLREAEGALRQSEERFRHLFENAPLPYQSLDEDGILLLVNETWLNALGYTREEVLGRSIGDFMTEGCRERLPGRFAQFRAEGLVNGVEWELVRKDGTTLLASFSGRVSRDETGRFQRTHCTFLDITERRAVEEKLALVARFPMENPNPVLRVDAGGVLLFANPASAALLSAWGQELGGRLPEELRQAAAQTLSSGQTQTTERTYGDQIYAITLSPFVEKGYVNVYAQNITARKHAEKALRQSEELFRTLTQVSPVGIFRDDLEGNCTFVSEQWCRITGYAAEQAMGTGWRKIIPQEELEQALAGLQAAMAAHRAFEVQERFLRADGEAIWALVRAEPELDAAGEPCGYVGAMTDITELRRTQEALRQSEELFRTLAQISPVGIFRADTRGQATYLNEQWSRITGHEHQAAMGSGWMDTLHPDDRQRSVQAFQRAVSAGQSFEFESLHRSPEGRNVWVLCRAEPERNAEGLVIGYVGAVTDISEQKRAQDALRQAKAQAEAATQAKAQFLANMSHEIRTPLAGVIGTTRLLAQSRLDQEQQRLAEMAVDSGRALLEVVNDILDFSKIEAGRLTLRPAPFGLRRAIDAVAAPFMVLARERGLTLDLEVDPATPDALLGDEGRLSQVLRNLLSNALKFTDTGGIRLVAGLEGKPEAEADSLMLRFSVIDTGVGIDPGYLPRIFDSFSQADSSYGKQHGGTGLGLAICKSLVEQMGGAMRGASRPGAGSTFTFTARLGLQPFSPAESRLKARLEAQEFVQRYPAPTANAGLNVLLAEDNAIGRVLMEHLLRSGGHQVTCAGDGQAVLKTLAEKPFDVVLMDVQMPRMDGLTATRLIRQGQAGEKNTGIAVVALTAYAGKEDHQRFMEAGMDDAVAKPAEERLLSAAMERAIKCAAGRGQKNTPKGQAAERPESAAAPEDAADSGADAAQTPRFDQGYLERSFADRQDLLESMLQQFKDSSLPEMEDGLRQALASGDLGRGGTAAHRARGSLGAVGSARAARLAAEADRAAHAGDAERFRELAQALLDELETLRQHLDSARPWGQEPSKENGA